MGHVIGQVSARWAMVAVSASALIGLASALTPRETQMTLRHRLAAGFAVTAALFWSAGSGLTGAAAATYTPLPAHVYAPYYETYLAPNTPSIAATAQAAGVKYFTLAFLQSTGKNSCSLDWNGNSAQPLSYYASDIAALRAAGGDVIPSFGGYSADQGGTEIADSCTSVSQIAADYEQVITTLGVTRLVFDYYIAGEGTVNMGQAAINAATSTHTQLASIFPSLSSAQLWNMEAMTLLPGIDDYPKKTEVTSLSDAQSMLNFAQANNMNLLSIWAIQRDNGGCPGTRDSNTCSGITQSTWDFSHLLEPFTG
jgi:hypothetical protein